MTGGFGPSLGPMSPIDPSRWSGTARVLGPRWSHLPTLTIGLLGVQIFWSVEMSYASPYLLSLGLSTSHVALVFLAGPLSGLLVQPLVGAYADTSTSRWGRRRPYILGGCMVCVMGMLLLGYTRAVAGWVFARDGHAHGVLTVILAVFAIFVIDFSINAVMAVDRALLVDILPPAQQAAGNACAAFMLGGGSVVGFFVGNLPLRTLLPFLNADSELQALSVLVSGLLLLCHGITAALVRERVLLKVVGARGLSLKREIREIYTHARALPRVIRQICFIQFFAWLGWFPVLFYTTMYITDVYLQEGSAFSSSSPSPSSLLAGNVTNGTTDYPPAVRLLARTLSASRFLPRNATTLPSPSLSSLANNSSSPLDAVPDADAPTRLGARAQLISALLALAANALLPFVIPDAASSPADKRDRRRGLRNSQIMGRVDLESVGLSPIDGGGSLANGNGVAMGHSLDVVGGGTGKGKEAWWRRMRVPDAMRVPLSTLWAASHLVFAGCMVGSFFTRSVAGATFLIACTGFSWGVTQWAPFSLLAEAILTSPAPSSTSGRRIISIRLADTRTRPENEEEEGFLVSRPGEESDDDEDSGGELEFVKPSSRDGDEARHGDADGRGYGTEEDDDDEDDVGGLYPPPPRKSANGAGSNGGLLLGNPAAQLSVVDVLTPRSGRFESEREPGGGFGDPGGDGIHNIFIVIPQFLVTGLSAAIFAIFDGAAAAPGHAPGPDVEPGRNSVVYVFRIGGIWASIAFVLAWRLARELRRQ
ncbi:MFS general substrate transporter [Mycena venus]|uniref:MFS general substrate transporter n=1 Tax=Mycena venus TaxID=2733690 RepID=A0A8H7CN93_9AGAR|nr:MFS general substrate transporter [Mycena venus]